MLEERGWQWDGNGETGPIGADWAIALASGVAFAPGSPRVDGPYLTTMAELEALIGRGSLMDWEAIPGGTADEVIALLRSGIVAGGPYPPLSPEEQEQQEVAADRWHAAMDRQLQALRQMTDRQGPVYEASRERSRIISAAYRAAGSPRKVSVRINQGRISYIFFRPLRRST